MSINKEEMISKMRPLIDKFLSRLQQLTIEKCDVQLAFINARCFYEYAYGLARHMYLYPNYREAFTDEDKKVFVEKFPTAFVNLAGHTQGVVSNIEDCDMNIAKTRLSEMSFVKNEIFNLYKELSGSDAKLTSDEQWAIKKLENRMEMISDDIETWSQPDYYSAMDRPNQVPDLNGVPDSHNWWTAQHRQMWKEKAKLN